MGISDLDTEVYQYNKGGESTELIKRSLEKKGHQ
jgi:hypothetical protein